MSNQDMGIVSEPEKDIRPIIFWEGFPVCGLLLRKVVNEFGDNLIITATRPTVPFEDLEKILEHRIIWLDDANDIWERREEFGDRNLIVHTGWRYKGWQKYDAYMKKRTGARSVVVVDNRYRGDLRQFLGAIYFRFFLKRYFDAAFVPGKSGKRLMSLLGMKPERIYSPNYGAYEDIYRDIRPITERAREFLFVGQLIERKGVDVLMEAFKQYRDNGGTWTLRVLGDGPIKDICKIDGVVCDGFAQPRQAVEKMNNARVFILPSRHDNWGTVVCEAAACGMQLITTKMVGASVDIVRSGQNGIELNKLRANELKDAMFYFERMDDAKLKEGSRVSKEIAKDFDSQAYYNTFIKFAHDLLP